MLCINVVAKFKQPYILQGGSIMVRMSVYQEGHPASSTAQSVFVQKGGILLACHLLVSLSKLCHVYVCVIMYIRDP